MNHSKWKAEVRSKEARIQQAIPMVSARTYATRDEKLKKSGLLDFERFWLVSHRTDTKGMRAMLKYRKEIFVEAKWRGLSLPEYRREIIDRYNNEGWTFRNSKPNPFDMVDYYRKQANADVTPTEAERKRERNFQKALLATRKKEGLL